MLALPAAPLVGPLVFSLFLSFSQESSLLLFFFAFLSFFHPLFFTLPVLFLCVCLPMDFVLPLLFALFSVSEIYDGGERDKSVDEKKIGHYHFTGASVCSLLPLHSKT